VHVKRNKSDVYKTSSNNFKLNKLIKFSPKISLEKGMFLFFNWYKNKS
jgi:nucleoside-diphosphate-sugar epimerase